MPVLFDTNFLVPLLDPATKVDPSLKAKLLYLVEQISEAGDRIIIPTPALSELLIGAGAAMGEYINILNGSRCFRIAPFDQRAAIELAAWHSSAISAGDKRDGSTEPWQKVNFDKQIVAIAKVEGVGVIYSHDTDIYRHAAKIGIKVLTLADLVEPPMTAQIELELDPRFPGTSDGE